MAKTISNIINKVHNIDSRKISEVISKRVKVQTTITSPPYFDMKDYGSDNQVGYGQKYDEYLRDLKDIFEQIFDRTKDNGTLWVIIDTFKRDGRVVPLPFDLVSKLSEIGWRLQEVIIWKKDKTVPLSSNGIMQRKFEYILFLSKSDNYKSNKDRVRVYDTNQLKKWWVKYPERYNPKGKALDEIWEFSIPVQGSWGDKYIRHFCPLPKEMVTTMIDISSDEGDIVMDPFAGTGTVLSQSAYMNRNYIGFELNPEYISMFETYLTDTLSKCKSEYNTLRNDNGQQDFAKQIRNLRTLKYARLLVNLLEKDNPELNLKVFVEEGDLSTIENNAIYAHYCFIGQCNNENILNLIEYYVSKPPLSKFGIKPNFTFAKCMKYDNNIHFGYTKTNSYSYVRVDDLNISKAKVISKIMVDLNEKDYE